MAKHLAAKYGGKSPTEDLFAAMPPFELVKALLVKCVQRRERLKRVRKMLFIDVSKAHLYAPVGEGIKNYVDLARSVLSRESVACSTFGCMG